MTPKRTLTEIASKALIKDLRVALSVPPQALLSLADMTNSDRGLRVDDQTALAKAWVECNASFDSLSDTFSVLRFLFGFVVSNEKSPDELLVEMEQLCIQNEIEGYAERRDALRLLLTPTEGYKKRRMILPWAQRGFANLVGVDTAVQLRGAFSAARSEELTGLIPMMVLRIESGFDDDEESQVQRFAIQLTSEDVDYLITRLKIAKKQLVSLQKQVRSQDLVLEHVPGGLWKKSHGNG